MLHRKRTLSRRAVRLRFFVFLSLAVLLLLLSVVAMRGMPYDNDGDPYHQFNAYFPEQNDGKLPVIIDIHGGGRDFQSRPIELFSGLRRDLDKEY